MSDDIMNLDQAIASEHPRLRGPSCWTTAAEAHYGKQWTKVLALFEEVRNDERTAASVARILAKSGYKVGASSVIRHARGECGCDRA